MTKYIKTHEQYILKHHNNLSVTHDILRYHQIQIEHLKHERLVHLIVMTFVGILFFISLLCLLIDSSLAIIILSTILFILEIFYIRHYYILENTLQRWYMIENTFIHHLSGFGTNLHDDSSKSS